MPNIHATVSAEKRGQKYPSQAHRESKDSITLDANTTSGRTDVRVNIRESGFVAVEIRRDGKTVHAAVVLGENTHTRREPYNCWPIHSVTRDEDGREVWRNVGNYPTEAQAREYIEQQGKFYPGGRYEMSAPRTV